MGQETWDVEPAYALQLRIYVLESVTLRWCIPMNTMY